jgi:hypothetical protein
MDNQNNIKLNFEVMSKIQEKIIRISISILLISSESWILQRPGNIHHYLLEFYHRKLNQE